VGLLALLVVALVHGRPYFSAGRSLVRGERAINRHEYGVASVELQKVLKVAPHSQKAILFAAKAAMMDCDISSAQKALQLRTTYEQNSLFTEVNGLWERALKGYEDAIKAGKLDEDGKHDEEAAQLMQQASREFPECKELKIASEGYTGGAAFVKKDYDGFLSHSTAALQMDPNNPDLLGTEASALAAKYASTGAPEFQARAEEDLKKAEHLSQSDPKGKVRFDEYSERIRYRLQTREIIDRDEYNRRFRNGKDPLKGAS
jgi:tetratricopeptide (TPR) repeat protein